MPFTTRDSPARTRAQAQAQETPRRTQSSYPVLAVYSLYPSTNHTIPMVASGFELVPRAMQDLPQSSILRKPFPKGQASSFDGKNDANPWEPQPPSYIQAWKKNADTDMEQGLKGYRVEFEANTQSVLRVWKSNHAINRYHEDLPFATIDGLFDWEMKCALRGDWKGLEHLLSGEQELTEPELMKPDPQCKQQWKLAVGVYRERQIYEETRKLVKRIMKEGETFLNHKKSINAVIEVLREERELETKAAKADNQKPKQKSKQNGARKQAQQVAISGEERAAIILVQMQNTDLDLNLEACLKRTADQMDEDAPSPESSRGVKAARR